MEIFNRFILINNLGYAKSLDAIELELLPDQEVGIQLLPETQVLVFNNLKLFKA